MAYEFKLPDIGEGVVEGEIVKWLVEPGVTVEEDQPMIEVMTDKANVEIPSPVAGTVIECRGVEGDTIQVGEVLVVIEGEKDSSEQMPAVSEGTAAAENSAPSGPAEKPSTQKSSARILATPAVRKKARDLGIDLTQVTGTGPSGRITEPDLQPTSQPDKTRTAAQSEPDSIPYRGIRRKIGKHLQESKRNAVHYTYVEEADVTELVRLREICLKDAQFENLTYLPFILKAVVDGLKRFPFLNSTLDERGEEIVLKSEYNIGIATATKEGLIVPVVKNVDRKNIRQLSEEIRKLVEKTREGKAHLSELQNGTFTVTSLGPLGGLVATPIINYPEVAILGVHKIRRTPVVLNDQIVIRDMMNLSITADHRIVDGFQAAEFLKSVIRLLEHPGLFALRSSD